jgi:hypothetical protein
MSCAWQLFKAMKTTDKNWCCWVMMNLVWSHHFANSTLVMMTITNHRWPICWIFIPFLRLSFPYYHWWYGFLYAKFWHRGPSGVWPVGRGCFILHDIWSYVHICHGVRTTLNFAYVGFGSCCKVIMNLIQSHHFANFTVVIKTLQFQIITGPYAE